MDKDRTAGSAKDCTDDDIAGDAKTQVAGRVCEATDTAQILYGHAKDAAREATDAAVSYAKDAYEYSGDAFRDGSQAMAKKVAGQSARFDVDRGRDRFCKGAAGNAHWLSGNGLDLRSRRLLFQ